MAPCFVCQNLLVPRIHLGSSAHQHVASRESPSSAGPYAAVRNPPTAGPSPRSTEVQRCLHTHGVGAVGILPVHSLFTSPPIELLHLRRRSYRPALGHRYFFGGDTAIAGPASPPLGTPLGSSSGKPLSAQLQARRTADHRTPLAPSVLLRQRVLGQVGEEEF
ncbi:hypothetical protein NDU88_002162 [Pleurodeles waltl]|uniref:Uncharacterized protein n=1 Tax=Pleurodeles waltl TaxID=8319 RepID=A0AAV7PA15_PLEWA|nr:hypothetical protein NDU88_002162 [Pleurodeles waltl]